MHATPESIVPILVSIAVSAVAFGLFGYALGRSHEVRAAHRRYLRRSLRAQYRHDPMPVPPLGRFRIAFDAPDGGRNAIIVRAINRKAAATRFEARTGLTEFTITPLPPRPDNSIELPAA